MSFERQKGASIRDLPKWDGSLESKIKKRIVIDQISLTASDWQLYARMQGSDEAASELNEVLRKSVESGDSRDEVIRKMRQALAKNADYGGTDNEPYQVLKDVIDIVFGKSTPGAYWNL